jgi:hypothetical protein
MSARTLPFLGVDNEAVLASLSQHVSCESKVSLDLVYQLPQWLAWRM